MILALSTLPVAVIAWLDDLADRVRLGHVRVDAGRGAAVLRDVLG